MSAQNIIDVLTDNGIPTGALELYYNFSGIEELGGQFDRVLSDSILPQPFSGKFYKNGNRVSDFATDALIEESGLLFYGGAIETGGIPNWNYIEIQNTTGITEPEFTIIFAGGLKKADFIPTLYTGQIISGADGHAYNGYPIFSNRNSGQYCADGWEVGLTNSNRLYFECIDPYALMPVCATVPFNSPGENVWFVRYNTSNIDFGRFDLFNEDIIYDTVQMNGLLNGDRWVIGSGLNDPVNLVGTGYYNSKTFLGNIRDFAYFSAAISDDAIIDITKAIYGSCNTGGDIYQTFYGATGITGSGIVSVTGITGYSYTEVPVGAAVNENFTYFQLLTGNIANGDEYYVPYSSILGDGTDYSSGQDIVYQLLVNEGSAITGITGFNILTGVTGLTTGDWSYYTATPLTGVLGQTVEFLYGSGNISVLSGATNLECEIEYPDFLKPYSRTYLLERYSTGDFVENQSGIMQTGEVLINKRANISNSRIFPGSTPFFLEANDQDESNLFIGGIGRYSSGIVIGEEEKIIFEYISGDSYYSRDCEGGEVITSAQINEIIRSSRERQYMLLGDWYLTGLEVIESLPFTGEESELVNATYDRLQVGDRKIFRATGLESHTGLSNYDIPEFFEDLLFFNGQKIYSGEHFTGHYNGSYTEFRPFGWITGETGAYFSFPKYTGVTTWTGYQDYDFNGQYFWPRSFVTWINGVRTVDEGFLEHDRRADLIKNREAIAENFIQVY